MRLITFSPPEAGATRGSRPERVGVLHHGAVVDLYAASFADAARRGLGVEDAAAHAGRHTPRDMVAFFAAADGRRRAEQVVAAALAAQEAGDADAGPSGEPAVRPQDSVRTLAPVPRPRRIRDYLCYPAHLKLTSEVFPEVFSAMPIAWKGNPDTVVGPGEPLRWPAYTDQLDFELELGFYVGRPGQDIAVHDAWSHIAGVTVFNDVSARDIQFYEMGMNLGPAKGKDFCTAMGPCVVTLDEIDPLDIRVSARVNGETWVTTDTSTAAYSFAEVLAWASYGEPVHPGEFLATGTVDGGCGLELDRWLRPGDVVELEAEGIGVLRNPVGAKEAAPSGAGLPGFTGAPRADGHR